MVADAVNTCGTTSLGHRPVVPDCNLSSDIGCLMEKGSFHDVTLSVGTTEFKAHKAILAGMEEKEEEREREREFGKVLL